MKKHTKPFEKTKISDNNTYINGSGGSVVSNNILSGKDKIKWGFRKYSINHNDNGWRFISDIDDETYINDSNNLSVCDFNSMIKIEPTVIKIYYYPIGSEFKVIKSEKNEIIIIDTKTGNII